MVNDEGQDDESIKVDSIVVIKDIVDNSVPLFLAHSHHKDYDDQDECIRRVEH